MIPSSIRNKILTGMLALVTALSFSFADFSVAFADDEPVDASTPIEQVEDVNSVQNEDQTANSETESEEPIIEPEPQEPEEPAVEIPSRGLVEAITQSEDSWLSTPEGLANVRELAKQGPTSYNVLQGSCSNGKKYFYFVFMKKATTKVKIIRMKLTDAGELKYSKSSGVIDNYHGNGMTYVQDSNGNGKILITNYWSGHTRFTVLNASTMKVEGEVISTYWKKAERKNCEIIYADGTPLEDQLTLKEYFDENGKYGFSGVAYDKKNNRVVASLQTLHDLIVFDLVTNSDGSLSLVPRKYIVEDRAESTIQDIDCDSDYIYMTWSAGNGIAGNRICVYDWNGNNVKNYIADYSYEIEGMFHTGSGDSAQFYATYHHSYLYDKVTYTKKKVKWKKVWNKAHTKKIWKYKTKKVKKVTTYIYRNGYLRNLGNLTTA